MSSFTTSSIITIVSVDNQVSNGPYSIGFEFLDESHIKVQRVDTGTDLEVANYTVDKTNNQITFTGLTLAAGDEFRVRRDTDLNTPVSTFFPGSSIRSQDLNNNFTQTLFALQEEDQQNLSKVGDTLQGNLSLDGNYRITNVPAPTANDHVVNKLYVDNKLADSSAIVQAAQQATSSLDEFNSYWAGAHASAPAFSSNDELGKFYFNTTERALYFLSEVDGVRQWTRSTEATIPTQTFNFEFAANASGIDLILPADYYPSLSPENSQYAENAYITGEDQNGNDFLLPSTGCVVLRTRNNVTDVLAAGPTADYVVIPNGFFELPSGVSHDSKHNQAIIFTNNNTAIDSTHVTNFTVLAFGDAIFGPAGFSNAEFVTGTENNQPFGKIKLTGTNGLPDVETTNLLPRFTVDTAQTTTTDVSATGANAPAVTVHPSTETNLSELRFKLPYVTFTSIATNSEGIPTYSFSAGSDVVGLNSIMGPQGKYISDLEVINNSNGSSTLRYELTNPADNNATTTHTITNLNLRGPQGETSSLGQATAHFVGDPDFTVTLDDNSTQTVICDSAKFVLAKALKRGAKYRIQLDALGTNGVVNLIFTPFNSGVQSSQTTVSYTIQSSNLSTERIALKDAINSAITYAVATIVGDDIIVSDNLPNSADRTYTLVAAAYTGDPAPTANVDQLVTYNNGAGNDYDVHVVLPNFDIESTVTTTVQEPSVTPTASVAYNSVSQKWEFTIDTQKGSPGVDAQVSIDSTIASGTARVNEQTGSTNQNRQYQIQLPDKWHFTSGAPANTVGVDGDMVYDYNNHTFYGPKASGEYTSGDQLKEITNVEYIGSTHADAATHEGKVKITFNVGDPVYTADIRQTGQLTDSDFSNSESGFLKKNSTGVYSVDTNSYLTSISDSDVTEAAVTQHQAALTIQESQISDLQSYLTSETSHADVLVDAEFASQGLMKRGSESGSYSIVTDNSSDWNEAHGWGNHALAGYVNDADFANDSSGNETASGILAKSSNGTYYVDTNTYLTGIGDAIVDPGGEVAGVLKRASDGTYSIGTDDNDNTLYDLLVNDDNSVSPNGVKISLRETGTTNDDNVIIKGTSTTVANTAYDKVTVSIDTNSHIVVDVENYFGATSADPGRTGLVPAAPAGSNQKFLRGDGTWNTVTATLPDTGVTQGSFGSSSQVPVFNVDTKGRLTSVTNENISISASNISGGTLEVTQIPNLGAGKITSGVFSSSLIPSLPYVPTDGAFTLGGNMSVGTYAFTAFGENNFNFQPQQGRLVVNGYNNGEGVTNQGSITLNCENNSHGVTLKSPPHSDYSGSPSFYLPGADGSTNQVLKTNGSGALGWISLPSEFSGSSAGLVPQATTGDSNKYLSGDGQWSDINVAGIASVSADTSPELGGNLHTIGESILYSYPSGGVTSFSVEWETANTSNHRFASHPARSTEQKMVKVDGTETPIIDVFPGQVYEFNQTHSSNTSTGTGRIRFFETLHDTNGLSDPYDTDVTWDYVWDNVSFSATDYNDSNLNSRWTTFYTSSRKVRLTITDSTPQILYLGRHDDDYPVGCILRVVIPKSDASLNLNSLTDVNWSGSPVDNAVLQYDLSSSSWSPSLSSVITSVEDDTSPTLGGNLNAQHSRIYQKTGDTITINVTVSSSTTYNRRKDSTGHNNQSFYFDGVETPYFVLVPGNTYVFNQIDASNANYTGDYRHALWFSQSETGTEYTANVTYKTQWDAGGFTETHADTSISTAAARVPWSNENNVGTGGIYYRRTEIVVGESTPQVLWARSYMDLTSGGAKYMGNQMFIPNAASGGGGGSATTLGALSDVDTSTQSANNKWLLYNADAGEWQSSTVALNDFDSFNISSTPTHNDVIKWNNAASEWQNGVAVVDFANLSDVYTGNQGAGKFFYYNTSELRYEFTPIFISTLNDVDVAGASEGDFLRYNGTNWVDSNVTIPTNLNSLTNVVDGATSGNNDGEFLRWNATEARWENSAYTPDVTASSTTTFTNKTLGELKETVHVITQANWVNATDGFDPTDGPIQTLVCTGSSTLIPSFQNWINGHSVMLMLKNGASNAPINWDGQVTWVDGTAPTLDNSDWNVIEFWKANNTIYGVMIGKVA